MAKTTLPSFFVPAFIATCAGVGLDMLGNTLQNAYPDTPHWVWLILFWVSVVLLGGIPAWLFVWGAHAAYRWLRPLPISHGPLEIVFQHNVHFIRQNMVLIKGTNRGWSEDKYLLALHNGSADQSLHDVSLCVTECTKTHIHGSKPLKLEQDNEPGDLRPKDYRYFFFVSRERRSDGKVSPIVIQTFDEVGPIKIEAKQLKIKVAAFASTAYAEQVFDVTVNDENHLIVRPYVGTWAKEWGKNVVAYVSMSLPIKTSASVLGTPEATSDSDHAVPIGKAGLQETSVSDLSIQEASQIAYERAEKDGWLDNIVGQTPSDPQLRLETFKYMMLVQARHLAITLCGAKPPSRQSLPIPAGEIDSLHPVQGESSLHYLSPKQVAYLTVTISREDLEKVITTYHAFATNGGNECP